MRSNLAALFVGAIFGAGVVLSDMVNPGRVQAFLDVAGQWDPTLMFVMGAALIPSALAYLLRRKLMRPVLAGRFFIPENAAPDRRLLVGAALFGIGWGIAGLCPGPALAGLALGAWQAWLFVAAMLVGMVAHRLLPAPADDLAVPRPATRRPTMTEYKHLAANLAVRPQVARHEIGQLAAEGYKGIINARPDGEEPGQPKSAELAAEAERHGLAYWHIPVAPGKATPADGARFAEALRECDGKVVGFCKTGARAAGLWDLASKHG